jgi:hypothetical protein
MIFLSFFFVVILEKANKAEQLNEKFSRFLKKVRMEVLQKLNSLGECCVFLNKKEA